MRLLEHEAKALLRSVGVNTPSGVVVDRPGDASDLPFSGPVAVKAQVPVGGRGKAGGVRIAHGDAEIEAAGAEILELTISGFPVRSILIEEALDVDRELYLAIAIDSGVGIPVVLASPHGGVDIESDPSTITRIPFAPDGSVPDAILDRVVTALEVEDANGAARAMTASLLEAFFGEDAILVEVNPLVVTTDGALVAADAKIELDDAADFRHHRSTESTTDGTDAELRAAQLGLRLIELGGEVAILANGAGLTMATMDAVVLAGGRPANFLEIGGDAYTKATAALELVLGLPGVRSLLVNFCGAFARCDVMAAGVVEAWQSLVPDVPVFFSIHGTGQDEARALVRDALAVEPFDRMDDAVAAAVAAAR